MLVISTTEIVSNCMSLYLSQIILFIYFASLLVPVRKRSCQSQSIGVASVPVSLREDVWLSLPVSRKVCSLYLLASVRVWPLYQ